MPLARLLTYSIVHEYPFIHHPDPRATAVMKRHDQTASREGKGLFNVHSHSTVHP